MISAEYRALNTQLHMERKDYGRSGRKWAVTVADLVKESGAQSVLDYGCGKSTFKNAFSQLSNIPVSEYDPCIPGKEKLPDPVDVVVCTDVMEHIEPEFLDEVLEHIHSLGKLFVMTVATREAKRKLPDGRNTHLIVRDVDWWREKLSEHFTILGIQMDPTENGEFLTIMARHT